jgi:hypothetical protein
LLTHEIKPLIMMARIHSGPGRRFRTARDKVSEQPVTRVPFQPGHPQQTD